MAVIQSFYESASSNVFKADSTSRSLKMHMISLVEIPSFCSASRNAFLIPVITVSNFNLFLCGLGGQRTLQRAKCSGNTPSPSKPMLIHKNLVRFAGHQFSRSKRLKKSWRFLKLYAAITSSTVLYLILIQFLFAILNIISGSRVPSM
jgi:hypothetical protein